MEGITALGGLWYATLSATPAILGLFIMNVSDQFLARKLYRKYDRIERRFKTYAPRLIIAGFTFTVATLMRFYRIIEPDTRFYVLVWLICLVLIFMLVNSSTLDIARKRGIAKKMLNMLLWLIGVGTFAFSVGLCYVGIIGKIGGVF